MKRSQLLNLPSQSSKQSFSERLFVFLSLSTKRFHYRKDLFLASLSTHLKGIGPLGMLNISSAIALLAIFLLVSCASKANAGALENLEKYENWNIKQFSNGVIFVLTHGEITHGDELIFALSTDDDCKKINQLFRLYTSANHKLVTQLENKVISITDNGEQTDARVVGVNEELKGHVVVFNMGHFKKDEIVKYYDFYERFQVGVLNSEHIEDIGQFNAKEFFDIPRNFWKTPHLKEALEIGEAYCEHHKKRFEATYERI